jgi:hypothetical protein
MSMPDAELARLRNRGADFNLVEPLVTPSVARGYLIMSGLVVNAQERGEPEDLRLADINPWSCAAYAIYRSGEAQLFSDAFRGVTERDESAAVDLSGLVVAPEGSVRPNPAMTFSDRLLRRFGQALVTEYGFRDDPSQPTAVAA